MGLSLPMTASAPATSAERVRLAEATGRRAVELAEAGGPTFAEILTPEAFRNGLAVLQALGGSTNGVVHLAALAGRLGRRLDLAELDALGRQLPVLVDLKPSGVGYMAEFHEAGGVPRLLSEITDALDASAMTVGGATIAEVVAGVPPRYEERIMTALLSCWRTVNLVMAIPPFCQVVNWTGPGATSSTLLACQPRGQGPSRGDLADTRRGAGRPWCPQVDPPVQRMVPLPLPGWGG